MKRNTPIATQDSEPSKLIVYGGPPSQPTRAVCWACLIKDLPFELELGSLAAGPERRRLNPKSQIPVIVDGDFVLYEMPSILCYLSDKHGWDDLYPRDLETRALVNQYLHFHHNTTRLATFKLMGAHVTIAFGGPNAAGTSLDPIMVDTIVEVMESDNPLEMGQKAVAKQVAIIEGGYFFGGAPFLCGTEAPTIADIACYEELAQLRWAKLFSFENYPKIDSWLSEMAKLPHHDAAHQYNLALGDIATAPNTMERFQSATASGIEALSKLGVTMGQASG